MPSSWWRGSSGAITGRICRTEGVVKQRAKARVLANLYDDNIFCSLNSFFSSYPPPDREGMVPAVGSGVPTCPTLPLPRVAGRRPHATSQPEVVSPQKTSRSCGAWPGPGPACTKAADRCPRGRHVSGGDAHGRIGSQGGREKWAITTSRKGMYERP